jgi:N-acetylmuramoyl-L-alanine amidase
VRFDNFGWLDVAVRKPTRNFNAGSGPPELIVMHYTASYEGRSPVQTFLNPNSSASAHFVVDTDGMITQMVSVRDDAWHAGGGVYQGRDDVNRFAVGVEIVNPGYHFKATDGTVLNWEHKPVTKAELAPFPGMIDAPDPWVGSHSYLWPKYPEPQLKVVQQLTRALITSYPTIKDIAGHRDVDTVRKRKVDPGPAFPIKRFRDVFDKRMVPPPPRPVDYLVKSDLGYLNVRSTPSITAAKADWSPLLNGDRVQKIDERPDWFRIRRWQAGVSRDGWVMARYLVKA